MADDVEGAAVAVYSPSDNIQEEAVIRVDVPLEGPEEISHHQDEIVLEEAAD